MPSLPVLRGSDAVKVFKRFGWAVARQSSSHIIMTKEGEIASLSIPNHKKSPGERCAVSFVRQI
ncbi:MAG: hypothetical protein QOH71_3263 [Blastocatellia bacterium]|jgi:predicted RNA binding protein YcfA (HicA-like mRNA interferase family)|nr:hypothetical protein [Blastocatellia bacterium]